MPARNVVSACVRVGIAKRYASFALATTVEPLLDCWLKDAYPRPRRNRPIAEHDARADDGVMPDPRPAEDDSADADEDVILDHDFAATDLLHEPQAQPMRVRRGDRDERRDVTVASDNN